MDRAVDVLLPVCGGIIAVVPPGASWDHPGVRVVTGGATRSMSVRAGLSAVPAHASIVVIHDAAHPLARPVLIDGVVESVREGADGAVPGLPCAETVLRVEDGSATSRIAGPGLVLAQMPHAFRTSVLRSAYRKERDVSDEASLLVELGHSLRIVPGDPRNVHITTAGDLELAAALTD